MRSVGASPGWYSTGRTGSSGSKPRSSRCSLCSGAGRPRSYGTRACGGTPGLAVVATPVSSFHLTILRRRRSSLVAGSGSPLFRPESGTVRDHLRLRHAATRTTGAVCTAEPFLGRDSHMARCLEYVAHTWQAEAHHRAETGPSLRHGGTEDVDATELSTGAGTATDAAGQRRSRCDW